MFTAIGIVLLIVLVALVGGLVYRHNAAKIEADAAKAKEAIDAIKKL